MKKLFLYALVATIMFSSAAMAGSCCTGKKEYGHHGKMKDGTHYFMLGGALVGNGEVNNSLTDMGYGEFSRYGLSLGFGGIRRYRRYIRGGEFEGLFWRRNKTDNNESRFSAGRFFSLHGFSLVSTPNVSLYPLVGIGGGVTSLWAGPRDVPFDSALAIPSQLPESSPLHQLTFLIDLGLGLHFSHPMPRGKPGRMTIGLRAGYILDPVDNGRWYRNSVRLTDGPDSDLSGPYVRLTLGGSGMRNRKECCRPHRRGECKKACEMKKGGVKK
ncbi:MAG: hypothetical protein JW913_04935 [Chitinispirillaceae bacterium]|nr:hypothetical protein [Chitinispirillaceae bacterium]